MSASTPFEIASDGFAEKLQLRLKIEIRRDIKHFSGLASVVEGLQSLDGLLRTEIDESKPVALKNSLLDARAQLLKFRVNSDPVAEVMANHPWLAVLTVAVVVVRDYERFRSSVGAMKADAQTFINGIQGLTEAQRQHVIVGAHLLLDRLLELSAESLRSWINRLDRARKALAGPIGEPPIVSIERDVTSSNHSL